MIEMEGVIVSSNVLENCDGVGELVTLVVLAGDSEGVPVSESVEPAESVSDELADLNSLEGEVESELLSREVKEWLGLLLMLTEGVGLAISVAVRVGSSLCDTPVFVAEMERLAVCDEVLDVTG